MTEHTVFVYGTLKIGHGNNRLLQSATYIGAGKTVKPFWMLDTGGFPVVFDDHHQHPVYGELWECDGHVLDRLDGLEGHPTWYCRKQTLVDLEDTGVHVSAWMYVGVPPAWKNRDRLQRVPTVDGVYHWRYKHAV